jgi:predicted glycoside hydrolase/deacetylase ChbG (UPF0249 family)
MRKLIVNADDFGLSPGVNRGIVAAHVYGIVTSTSVMVRWPAAHDAINCARAFPNISFGLHCDVGEWVFRHGQWEALYQVVQLDDTDAVTAEVKRQLSEFQQLIGRPPTHLDSHQHVHSREPVRSVLVKAATELGIPLRHCEPRIRYCGEFYGQGDQSEPRPSAIDVDALVAVLKRVPEGVTELACHPAEAIDFDSVYRAERIVELQTLCDRRVREALEHDDITLASFANWAAAAGERA